MSTFARLLVVLLFASAASAQTPPRLRASDLVSPWITRFETSEASARTTTTRTAAFTTLAWLRLADHARARGALASCCAAVDLDAGADRVDPAWAAAALLWFLRATHDDETVRRHLPRVAAALASIGPAAAREHFADETLLAHGMLCIAAVESFLDLDRPREGSEANGWSRRAIDRWLDLERRAWQPGRQHFRSRPTDGSLALPEPADVVVLWPAAAGMLIATGERATQNARTVLRAAFFTTMDDDRRTRFGSDHAPALLSSAATQFEGPSLRRAAWTRLVEHGAANASPPLDVAALDLDTALFAITGVRLATGAGVDEGWLRLRPWLPPDTEHAQLRGVHAEGVRFDLAIERRRGDLAADELDADLTTPSTGERLRVTLSLDAATPRPIRVVLQGPSIQYVTSLAPGATFARSLPTADP